MGRKMLNKLRSRKGASITFALLAFLVCAVISAVLLASASASAGRLSGLAEADRRYYAVTSAAQLFCDTLPDKEYIIERRLESKATKRTDYIADATAEAGFTFVGPYDYAPEGSGDAYFYNKYSLWMKTPADTDTEPHKIGMLSNEKNLGENLALYYVFGDLSSDLSPSQALTDLVTRTFDNRSGNGTVLNMTMTVVDEEGAVSDLDFLTVDVELTMSEKGALDIKFTNHIEDDDEDQRKFMVEVVMMPKITDNFDNPIVKETTSISNFSESETSFYELKSTERETTKTTTISWTVSEIKKVS